jgi:AraC-like DNA-binding protein
MTPIALTRVSSIVPILRFMDRAGAPTSRILDAAHMPRWISSNPEALIPGDTPVRLFAAASRREAIPNLGLMAGERATIDSLGVFGRLFASSPTLGAALESSVLYQTMLASRRPLSLRLREDRAEYRMAVLDRVDPRDPHWKEDNHYCLALMMAVIRYALGPDWRPEEVHLQTDEAPALRDAESLAAARIAFRQPAIMVAVPRTALGAPMPSVPLGLSSDVIEDWKSSAPASDFAPCIRQAIETLSSGDDYPSVRQTAEFVGMSVRTLQRRLAAAGVSHDTLIAQSRFATAAAVLERTQGKVLELALNLGYSDHANFTRAFRRWSGCSPQEYRSRYGRDRGPRPARRGRGR